MACSFVISAHAQTTTLALQNGKATVKNILQPRSVGVARFYFLKLRTGQAIEIKVDSNTIYLNEENGCGMGFELFAPKGQRIDLGDAPDEIDHWQGRVKETGNYKIKVAMHCLESFTTEEVRKKKPTFKYSLNVQLKKDLFE